MTQSVPTRVILTAALGLGVAGDHLLRTSSGPGLNFVLLFAGLAASLAVVTVSSDSRLSGEAWAWVAAGLACSLGLLWRGSGLIRFLCFVAACAAFTLPTLRAGRAWIRHSGVLDYVEAAFGAALHAGFGAFGLMRHRLPTVGSSEHPDGPSTALRLTRAAVVGAALATLPLIVFGSLFTSADPVFARLLGDLVRVDLGDIASHIAATAILTWLACGYLVGAFRGTGVPAAQRIRASVPTLGTVEIGVALGLVNALFLGFVAVQFRYLFGGSAWVEVTPGLTYAEYAREGFFQLVAAVALALPWLLAAHALLGERTHRDRTLFRALGGAQVLLLLAIVVSAIQRMSAYQDAYGLSEDRIVASAILFWLAGVVLWFGGTVLTGRRDRFAAGFVVSAFVLVGSLPVLNPAGWAARYNLEHRDELGSLDVPYLTHLGSDAVPYMAEVLQTLAPADQCRVSRAYLDRWGPDHVVDWKAYNWSEARARQIVAAHGTQLEQIQGERLCLEMAGRLMPRTDPTPDELPDATP